MNSVEFFNDNVSLGTVNTSPYTITWDNVDPGSYNLSAKVTDNDDLSSISPLIFISVTKNMSSTIDIDNKDIVLYPNPVSDKLTLQINDSFSDNLYAILYNSQGAIIMEKKIANNKHILDLKSILKGGAIILV